LAIQISVEHFDVEPSEDERFEVKIHITGWSDSDPDSDEPDLIEFLLDDREVDTLIEKLQAVRWGTDV